MNSARKPSHIRFRLNINNNKTKIATVLKATFLSIVYNTRSPHSVWGKHYPSPFLPAFQRSQVKNQTCTLSSRSLQGQYRINFTAFLATLCGITFSRSKDAGPRGGFGEAARRPLGVIAAEEESRTERGSPAPTGNNGGRRAPRGILSLMPDIMKMMRRRSRERKTTSSGRRENNNTHCRRSTDRERQRCER